MKYTYIHVGEENDYSKFYIDCSVNDCNNVYYSRLPNEHLGLMMRSLFRVHNAHPINKIVCLPFRKIWAGKIIDPKIKQAISKKDNCFLISGLQYRYAELGFIKYLRNNYPNCKIVYLFPDKVSKYLKFFPNMRVESLKVQFDLVITYNYYDATEFGLVVSPPKLAKYPEAIIQSNLPNTDVFFVGQDKGRYNDIIAVYEKCVDEGLICDFWIVGVDKECQKYSDSISYNTHLTYIEVLQHLNASKAVLNIMQPGTSGLTLRDYEAIGMNKVLITNSHAIQNTEFYKSEKVIFVDENTPYKRKVMNSDNYQWNCKNALSSASWYEWLDRKLVEEYIE